MSVGRSTVSCLSRHAQSKARAVKKNKRHRQIKDGRIASCAGRSKPRGQRTRTNKARRPRYGVRERRNVHDAPRIRTQLTPYVIRACVC